MTDFLRGAAWPFRGLAFLAVRPGLWPWVAAPALLAVVLVYLAWIASWAWAPVMLHAVWPQPATPGFVRNLWNGTAFVLIVWAFATFVMLLHGFVGVLGTPFYDRLSQRVEAIARPAEAEPFAWRVFVVDIGWSALHSVQALGLWLLSLGVLALLNTIPVVGTAVEIVASALFTAWFLSREMIDGIASRRRWSFREKLAFVARHGPLMTGFGLACAVLLAVPVVNLLTWPAAVVAGTLFFLEVEDEERSAPVTPSDPGSAGASGCHPRPPIE